MKKLLTLLAATAAFSLLPSVSQALCVTTGEIPRVTVFPGAGVSSFLVRTSTPGSITFGFFTTDVKVIDAALNAQASHENVQVFGDAVVCGPVIGGLRLGGTVNNISTAP